MPKDDLFETVNEPITGSDLIGSGNNSVAFSFTSAGNGDLTDVQVSLQDALGSNDYGDITVTLLTDGDGEPGTAIAVLGTIDAHQIGTAPKTIDVPRQGKRHARLRCGRRPPPRPVTAMA